MNSIRLKELLKSTKTKQCELAENLNVTNAAVSHWVNGDRDPSDEIKVKLAAFFGVSVEYLMDSSTPPNKATDYEHERGWAVQGGPFGAVSDSTGTSPAADSTGGAEPSGAIVLSERNVILIPVFPQGDSSEPHSYPIPKQALEQMGRADASGLFAVYISDDVMTPYLPTGCVAICASTNDVKPGDLVVFTLRGNCLVRGIRLDHDGAVATLLTGNKLYSDMPVDDDIRADLQIVGRVLRYFAPSVKPPALM